MVLIQVGEQPQTVRDLDPGTFTRTMNQRSDVGRVEVIIQVAETRVGPWLDYVELWTGEWDRHNPPRLPTRADIQAIAGTSGARFGRCVVRSEV